MRLGVGSAIVEGVRVLGDVEIDDGTVTAVGIHPAGASDRVAAAGFLDLQINGIGTIDFLHTDATGFEAAASELAGHGVTAFAPTFVTSPPEDVERALRELDAADLPIRSLGAHLEGPFLSPDHLGAHDAAWRRDPDADLAERLLAAGAVGHVTLAPELPGALELIDQLLGRGVTVSCGHSGADARGAHAAFDRGARTVTHLFNAMAFGTHRAPAVGMAALARPDVAVTLILDGHHVSADAASMAWNAARGRLALVTDRVAEHPDGVSTTHPGDPIRVGGTLAGSTVTMIECVRALRDLGANDEASIAAATEVPARIRGRDDVGRISVGGRADVVVLDDAFEVHDTLVEGVSLL